MKTLSFLLILILIALGLSLIILLIILYTSLTLIEKIINWFADQIHKFLCGEKVE
jgi:hypothetical protein